MTHLGDTLKFLLRYTVVGLALAFLVVAFRPQWLPKSILPTLGSRSASYASAVQVSAAAPVPSQMLTCSRRPIATPNARTQSARISALERVDLVT